MGAEATTQACMMQKDTNECEMTENDYMSKEMINPEGVPKKPHRFPETLAEQQTICKTALVLKERGNTYFVSGQYMEAAKLYEQGLLEFASWYAESFATDEERSMVHTIKQPCHLNLAECSRRLGNHQHVVVHCTEVISFMDPQNVKALFRRGASHLRLGNLDEAHIDLKRAIALSPGDSHVRSEFAILEEMTREYRARTRALAARALADVRTADAIQLMPACATDMDSSHARGRRTEASGATTNAASRECKTDASWHDQAHEAVLSSRAAASGIVSLMDVMHTDMSQGDEHASIVTAKKAWMVATRLTSQARPAELQMASEAMLSERFAEVLVELRVLDALIKLDQEPDREVDREADQYPIWEENRMGAVSSETRSCEP
tara:strand:- start:575 stop:1714 length:1140 start_codon:yes stop_codon:yes gene_type:complete